MKCSTYAQRGCVVTSILADNYNSMHTHDNACPVTLDIYAAVLDS